MCISNSVPKVETFALHKTFIEKVVITCLENSFANYSMLCGRYRPAINSVNICAEDSYFIQKNFKVAFALL